MAFGTGAKFNEPQTDDTTSAPPAPVPSSSAVSVASPDNPFQALLGKKKRNPRSPAPLARAISQSKRGYQSKRKWG